jgi:hypothetical protein
MRNETKKSFKLSAVLLALALLFPFTSQALHFISDHAHEQCTDKSVTHFHQHEYDCEIFDFQLSPISAFSANEKEGIVENNFELSFPQPEVVYINFRTNIIGLRGPPSKQAISFQ